jgi:uncharacterized membrane protein YbhN (UPF0104 family)
MIRQSKHMFLLKLLLMIIAAGWLVYYIVHNWNIFKTVLDVSSIHVVAIAIGIFLNWFINSTQIFILLRAKGIRIGFLENFTLLTASTTLNYLPVKAGVIMRLLYLKSVHALQYAHFGSIFAIRTTLLLVTTGLIGCAGMVGLSISGDGFNIKMMLAFCTIIFLSITAIFVPIPKLKNNNTRLSRIWTDFITDFEILRGNPLTSIKVIILIFIQFSIQSGRFYFAFDAVQFNPSPWFLLFIGPLTVLMALVAFTPGNLGFREAIIGCFSLIAISDFNIGILAGAVDRVVLLVMTFTFGIFCVVRIFMRFAFISKDTLKEKIGFINSDDIHNQ